MQKDISRQAWFAVLDVKTKKLNREINELRKSGKSIRVTLTGYLQEQDHSHWDGCSIEQGIIVATCKMEAK